MPFGLDLQVKYQHRPQMSTKTVQFIANFTKCIQYAEESKYCSKP
jgi:hypothetical protein